VDTIHDLVDHYSRTMDLADTEVGYNSASYKKSSVLSIVNLI